MKVATLFLVLALAGCGSHRTPSADLVNTDASIPAGLPYDPLKWRVITSAADPRDSTMSTLFGNDPAVDHARAGSEGAYPPGAVLALVTWRQTDDPHWYGAKIPAQIESIEYVTVESASNSYEKYAGSPLMKLQSTDSTGKRASEILSMRASVMP